MSRRRIGWVLLAGFLLVVVPGPASAEKLSKADKQAVKRLRKIVKEAKRDAKRLASERARDVAAIVKAAKKAGGGATGAKRTVADAADEVAGVEAGFSLDLPLLLGRKDGEIDDIVDEVTAAHGGSAPEFVQTGSCGQVELARKGLHQARDAARQKFEKGMKRARTQLCELGLVENRVVYEVAWLDHPDSLADYRTHSEPDKISSLSANSAGELDVTWVFQPRGPLDSLMGQRVDDVFYVELECADGSRRVERVRTQRIAFVGSDAGKRFTGLPPGKCIVRVYRYPGDLIDFEDLGLRRAHYRFDVDVIHVPEPKTVGQGPPDDPPPAAELKLYTVGNGNSVPTYVFDFLEQDAAIIVPDQTGVNVVNPGLDLPVISSGAFGSVGFESHPARDSAGNLTLWESKTDVWQITIVDGDALTGSTLVFEALSDIAPIVTDANGIAGEFLLVSPSGPFVKHITTDFVQQTLVDGATISQSGALGVPVAADRDPLTGDLYVAFEDQTDGNRSYVYRKDFTLGAPLTYVAECGVGVRDLDIVNDHLVTANEGSQDVCVFGRGPGQVFSSTPESVPGGGPVRFVDLHDAGDGKTDMVFANGTDVRCYELTAAGAPSFSQVDFLGPLDLEDLLDEPLHAAISPDGEDLAVAGPHDVLSAVLYKSAIETFR